MKIKTISAMALIAIFSLTSCDNKEQEIKDKQKELDAIQPKAEKLISEYDEMRAVIDEAMPSPPLPPSPKPTPFAPA